MHGFDVRQPLAPGVQIEGFIIGGVWNGQPATQIQNFHAADAARKAGQLVHHLLPVAHGFNPAAQVCMHAGDADIQCAGRVDELLHPLRRQPKFGLLATGIDLLMVAIAVPQINAQPQRATTKYLGPLL